MAVTTPVTNVSKLIQDFIETNGLNTCIRVPNGTTAQRPAVQFTGQLRWNSDTPGYEYWNGASWVTVSFAGATVVQGTNNQIAVSGPPNTPVVGLASNPVVPGTGGLTLPKGTAAQQAGGDGTLRYNTDVPQLEVKIAGAWHAVNVT